MVPEIWLPDPTIRRERELARFRLYLVRHRATPKNRIHAALMLSAIRARSRICSATPAANCWTASRRPGEGDVLARGPDGSVLHRYAATPPVRGTAGDVEALALYTGQSTGIVTQLRSAAAVVRDLAGGALKALGAADSGAKDRAAA
jgi:hypothetical protein